MADDPQYITQEALNAALKDIRDRQDKRLGDLRTELTGEIGKVSGTVMEGLKTSLPELLKPLLPQPAKPDPKAGEGAGGEGEGDGDGKPKGPFAARVAELEKALKAQQERAALIEKEREAEKKEREAERMRLRTQAIEQRKDNARARIESLLSGDKFIRDPERAEALRLKMEKDGLLTFDEQGTAKLTTKRVRFQGEPVEPKDFDLSTPEGLEAALADWRETEGAKKWLPAAPAAKPNAPGAKPAARQQTTPPTARERAAAEAQRSGEDLSEDEMLGAALDRMGGVDAVRAAIHSD